MALYFYGAKEDLDMWKKFTGCIMAICLLLAVMSSVSYISTHKNHICTGVDCPVCHTLEFAEQVLALVSNALVFSVILLFFRAVILQSGRNMQDVHIVPDTLVSQKVLLLN